MPLTISKEQSASTHYSLKLGIGFLVTEKETNTTQLLLMIFLSPIRMGQNVCVFGANFLGPNLHLCYSFSMKPRGQDCH